MEDPKLERRSIIFKPEIRAKGDKRMLVGHAAVFNSPAEIWLGFIEQFAPGCFAASLTADDQRCLHHHDWKKILGRRSAGTLTLQEDDKGLFMECDPPNWASDIVESVERGDVTGMSLGFIAEDEKWTKLDGANELRTILKARVIEVSITGVPAYDDTDLSLRDSLAGAGIDPETVKDAVARIKAGTASAADLALVTRGVETFREVRSRDRQQQPPAPKGDPMGVVQAMKARIEVARRR